MFIFRCNYCIPTAPHIICLQTLFSQPITPVALSSLFQQYTLMVMAPPKKRKTTTTTDDDGSKIKKTNKDTAGTSQGNGNPKNETTSDYSRTDFTSKAICKEGKIWNLKIASWNVNGLRAWAKKHGHDYISKEDPDIFCLQETKCTTKEVPKEVEVSGYYCYWLSGDKDGYSGTGLYTKTKPMSVSYGIDMNKHDKEGRCITAEYQQFYLVTAYVPNAGRGLVRLAYRQEWDADFLNYLKGLDKKKPVVYCGDLNVSHKEIDLKNPKTNTKNAGFTPEERAGFSKLLDAGFLDTYRQLYPEKEGAYTFWTFMMNCRAKDVGWRLDYFVISKRLESKLCDSVIRKYVMGSDHCPIVLLMAM